MDANEFRTRREEIERLCRDAQEALADQQTAKTLGILDEADRLTGALSGLARGDIQCHAVRRLSAEIERLSAKVDDILTQREAGKREDGNIAFKCNWNDRGYAAPCSQDAYEFNLSQHRAWCSSPDCGCRDYGESVSLEDYPCYESIALREMFFGAGWDHTGGVARLRQIKSAREEKLAVLTTRPPRTEEKDRLIVGCFVIAKVEDDPGTETRLRGDKERSLAVPYETVRVRFWDYYANPMAPNLVAWSSGLFRYISDGTAMKILRGIEAECTAADMDVSRVRALMAALQAT
jgi:hypothetical protein